MKCDFSECDLRVLENELYHILCKCSEGDFDLAVAGSHFDKSRVIRVLNVYNKVRDYLLDGSDCN